jgi:iron(II)-dependent oxidoreductase
VHSIVIPSDRLEIVLPRGKIQIGERMIFRAVVRGALGGERDVYPAWASDAGTIDPRSGQFHCRKTGKIEIRASLGSFAEPARVQVEVVPYKGGGWAPRENGGIAGPEVLPAELTRGDARGEYVHRKTGMIFVYVPGGAVLYGERLHESRVELPLRAKGFFIGKYEVTLGQFDRFLSEAGSQATRFGHPEEPEGHDYNLHWVTREGVDVEKIPASDVDWWGAFAYAAWAGLDLPTELQWETAASWDPKRGLKLPFPWGESWNRNLCNCASFWAGRDLATVDQALNYPWKGPSAPKTALKEVGTFPGGASPVGANDMAGNLYEWCLDRVEPTYAKTLAPGVVDPLDTRWVPRRTPRGGALYSSVERIRSSFSGHVKPGTKGWEWGFRCVLNPDLEPKKLSISCRRQTVATGLQSRLRALLHFRCGRFHIVNAAWSAPGADIKAETGAFSADVEGLYTVSARHGGSGLKAAMDLTVEDDPEAPWPAAMNDGIPPPPELPKGMVRGREPGEYVWQRNGSVMVYFPRGRYVVGSRRLDCQRWVEFDGFFIDKYEVSKERYKAFRSALKSEKNPERFHHPSKDRSVVPSPFGSFEGAPDGAAAVCMSWYEAWEYARWLGKSLPTAAEWEAAAVVHPCTKRRGNFPWGSGFSKDWTNTREYWDAQGITEGKPTPPGMFPKDRSPCGCMDMAGNVNEWCLYDERPPLTQFLPSTTTAEGKRKYVRYSEDMGMEIRPAKGGCFFWPYLLAQAPMGKMEPPMTGGRWTGFRCVVRLERWKTFARLAKSAREGGRMEEATALIQEVKLPFKPVPELVRAAKAAYDDLFSCGERSEEEGKPSDALGFYTLAGEVIPDSRAEKILEQRRARAQYCFTAFSDADKALRKRSKIHLLDGLSTIRKVLERNGGAPYEAWAREKEKSLLEALRVLGVAEKEHPDGGGKAPAKPPPEAPPPSKIEEILKLIKRARGGTSMSLSFEWAKAIDKLGAEDRDAIHLFIEALKENTRFGLDGRNAVSYACQAIARLGWFAGGETARLAAQTFDEEIRKYSRWTLDIVIGSAGDLGPYGSPCAKAIGGALERDKDPRGHLPILHTLGKIGPGARSALPALRRALDNPHLEFLQEGGQFNATVTLLRSVSRILPRAEAGEWLPAFVELTKKAPEFRKEVLTACARIGCGDKALIDLALQCARGQDKKLREHAVEKLGDLGPAAGEAVPQLTLLLKSPKSDRSFRKVIATTLRRIGPKSRSANSVLISLFKADKIDVFSMAFVMAGQGSAGKRYLPSIEAAFKEWEIRERRKVSKVSRTYIDVAFGKKPARDLAALMQSGFMGHSVLISEYLAGMGSRARSAVPKLIEMTGDGSEYTRGAAAVALGRIGTKSRAVEDGLRELLVDQELDVRTKAFRALETLGLWRGGEVGGAREGGK